VVQRKKSAFACNNYFYPDLREIFDASAFIPSDLSPPTKRLGLFTVAFGSACTPGDR
jgi:Asp-tRNA(Asn)/Glu-tRNA(Gln) amidotransferase B subunit